MPAAAAVTAARLRLDRAEAAQRELIGAREARDAQARAAGHRGERGKRPASLDEHAGVRKALASLARAEARAADAARKAAAKGPGRNITDPDSRLMPVRGGGFIQGYNAQNVTSADKLIIATELTDDTTGTGWFEPMLAAALDAATLITAHQPPPASTTPVPGGSAPACDCPVKLFLADAGYLSEDNLTIAGPDRLIATGKHRDLEKQARAGGNPETSARSGAITAMAARLATEEGITAYRQRGHIAETPHGHIKHNMGFRQLSMRGKPKSSRRMDLRRHRAQPLQSHHHRPPHHSSPGQPGSPARLTGPCRPGSRPALPAPARTDLTPPSLPIQPNESATARGTTPKS